MSQTQKYSPPVYGSDPSSNAAFSFSIESQQGGDALPQPAPIRYRDLNVPEELRSQDWIVPAFLLVNLGLIQLGFLLGYLDSANLSLVITVHSVGIIASLGVTWFCGKRFFMPAVDSLRSFEPTVEVMTTLGLLGLCAAGVTSFLDETLRAAPWSPAESFAFSSGLTVLYFALRDAGVRLFVTSCTFIPDEKSQPVHLLAAEGVASERDVHVSEVKPGSVIRLKANETVSVDCTVLKGLCEVSERKLSGQGVIRVKGEGDTLYAGSTVIQGAVDCKVQASPDESYITSFVGVVRRNLDAIVARLETQSVLERKVHIGTLFIATIAAVFWYGSGKGISFALSVFGSALLVTVFPFAIAMGAYLLRRGLLVSFANGILFRNFLVSADRLAESDVMVLDYNSRAPLGQLRVEAFELIDERVDRSALVSVLISIFGRSEEEFHTVATQFLRESLEDLRLYEISTLELYEDPGMPIHGIGALIEGIEFTIGSEELLVARGVQLQASEVSENDESCGYVYVAMQDEVVARFVLVPRFTHDGKELIQELKKQKMRTVLCSEEPSEITQPAAETIGVDIPDTFPALTGSRFTEKLDSLKPVALLTNKLTPRPVIEAATVSFGIFDEYKWDVEATDITLFNNELPRIGWLLKLMKRVRVIGKENFVFSAVISGLLVVCAASGLSDAAIIALSSLVASLYVYVHAAGAVERV